MTLENGDSDEKQEQKMSGGGSADEDGDGGVDGGERDVEEDFDEQEGRRPKMRRNPNEPTKEEIREHQITHTPFRSWCPECVKARGKATGHPGCEDEERGVPRVHIDYWFMRDGRGEESKTIAVMKDDDTKAIKAHAVPHKGNVAWVAEMLAKDIEDMGHSKRIIVKSDQEPALKDLVDALKRERESETIIENSKVKDSQSNGTIERAVQEHEGITRTMKLALERRLGKRIRSTHPVTSWLIEHAAATYNRYHVGPDGRTPYERIRGKKYKGEMTEFGQKVYHRSPGKMEGVNGDTMV